MEYASFYGGRRGSSFIIVKSYLDIPSMVNDFSQGGAFTGVNYDEYVIINTVNKNHPDNGKVFRRGYDYNSTRTIEAYHAYRANGTEIINGTPAEYREAVYNYDDSFLAGGAIYVGTIVGPAGRGPHLEFTTYELAEEKQATEGFEDRKTYGEYNLQNSLLPGKYIENEEIRYNDAIQWYCTSIRDDYNQDTQAYIGVKIPYPVIDYTTTVVDPYDFGGQYTDMTEATRTDDGTHPFYERWNLSIPHGIKGDTIKNFRVIIPQQEDIIYEVGTTDQYSGFDDDVENSRAILVYDYYNYDNEQNPEVITYYMGDYNQITDFTIASDGTVTMAFTHEDTVTYNQLIKWINNITLNQDSQGYSHPGRFIVTYNDGTSQTYDLDWVKDIRFGMDQQNHYDGTVYIDYTISNTTEYPKLIKWIDDISIATQTIEPYEPQEEGQQAIQGVTQGTFVIKYNDGTDLIEYLKWVNNITLSSRGALTLHYSGNGQDKVISSINQDNFIRWINDVDLSNDGTLTITYNTGTETTVYDPQMMVDVTTFTPDTEVFTNTIKWVTGVSFNPNGNIVVNYNTGSPDVYEDQVKWIQNVSLDNSTGIFKIQYNQNIPDYTTRLKWPKNVSIVTQSDMNQRQGMGSQKVKIDYTTGESEEIGQPLNYIMRSMITPNDRHLIVLYADPAKRASIVANHQAYNFGGADPYTDKYDGLGYTGWLDLGSVYTDTGILIGLNLSFEDIPTQQVPEQQGEIAMPTQEEIIGYLNFTYPNGLYGANMTGKIVTVGQQGSDKFFYGFDYNFETGTTNYKGWYYLGTFDNVSAVIMFQNDPPVNLQQDTLCFIIEEIYSISYNLTNIESTNKQTVIAAGGTYVTKLVGLINNISITMNGTDITSSVYNSVTSEIRIDSSNTTIKTVTGDLVITATGA